MGILDGKHIVLGVSGGIAAYKVADLASQLVQAGANVDVLMTKAATHFVGPITFQALTGRPVQLDLFDLKSEASIAHIAFGQADLLVIAPATANVLAKLAHGLADDVVTTTALAARCPIVVCPSMDVAMYESAVTQANLATLRERGVVVIEPAEGRLASGLFGKGRLPEVPVLLGYIHQVLGRGGPLAGRRVIVTAGGTQEPIDPVRFVGNRSSGKMGIALAESARDRGAAVTLIHGPLAVPTPVGVECIPAPTAAAMQVAVLDALAEADALVMAAAVADYRPTQAAEQKIKKQGAALAIDLEPTPNILAEVAARRSNFPRLLAVIGFAAETEDLLANAREKLARKRLDLIVANDVSQAESGFGADTNRVTLLDASGTVESLPLLPKTEVAEIVMDRVVRLLAGTKEGVVK